MLWFSDSNSANTQVALAARALPGLSRDRPSVQPFLGNAAHPLRGEDVNTQESKRTAYRSNGYDYTEVLLEHSSLTRRPRGRPAAAWRRPSYRYHSPPQSRLSEEEGLVHGCADSAKDRAWDVASTQAALLVERTNKYKAVGSYPPTNKSETVDIHTLFLSLPLFSTTFWATVNTKPGFVGCVPLPLWGFSYSVNIFFKGHFLSTFSCLYPSEATLANLFSDLTVSGFNTSIW